VGKEHHRGELALMGDFSLSWKARGLSCTAFQEKENSLGATGEGWKLGAPRTGTWKALSSVTGGLRNTADCYWPQ
jgi:hypothetical protein